MKEKKNLKLNSQQIKCLRTKLKKNNFKKNKKKSDDVGWARYFLT
jgi:hypothetical protein